MKHLSTFFISVFCIQFLCAQTFGDYLINTSSNEHKSAMTYGNGYIYLLSENGEKITKSDPNTRVNQWTTCYSTTLGNTSFAAHTGFSNRISFIPDGELVGACGEINGNPGYILVDNSGTILSETEYSDDPGRLLAISSFGINQEVIIAGTQDNLPFIARHNGSSDWQVVRDITKTSGIYRDIDIDEENDRIFTVGDQNEANSDSHLIDIYDLNGNLLESYELGEWYASELEQVEYLGNDRFMIGGVGGDGGMIAMLSVDGTVHWRYEMKFHLYGEHGHHNSSNPQVREIIQSRDGDIIVLWQLFVGTQVLVSKFDWSGNELWTREYYPSSGNPTNDGAMDIVSLQNENLILLTKEAGNDSHVSTLDLYGHVGDRTTCENDNEILYESIDGSTNNLTKDITTVGTSTTTALSTPPCTTLTENDECGCWFAYDPWPGRTAYFCNSATLTVPEVSGYTYTWTQEDGSALPSGITTAPENWERVITPSSEEVFEISVKIEVEDPNGCIGWDLVKIVITPDGTIPARHGLEVYCHDPQANYTNLYLPLHNDKSSSWTMTSWYEFNGSPIQSNDIMTDPALFTEPQGHIYNVELKIQDNFGGGCIVTAPHQYVFRDCNCNDPITLGEFDGEHDQDKLYGIIVPNSSITKEIHKFRFSLIDDVTKAPDEQTFMLHAGVMEEGSTFWGAWFTPILTDKKLRNWGPDIGDNNRDILLEVWYADPSTQQFDPISTCAYEQSELSAWVHAARKANPAIPEALIDEDDRQFRIYPNPSNGELFIEGLPSNSIISLYNLNGQEIQSRRTGDTESQIIMLNFGDKLNGVHLLRVTSSEGEVLTKKILFQ